jgi:RNA polymerase sigma factor (sigma-70 family)
VSDEDLARAQQWDALWEQLAERVRRLACRLARGDPTTADDLFQEAWLVFQRVIGRWNAGRGTPVWGWLAVVLRHRFLDLLNRRAREQPVEDCEALSEAMERETSRREESVRDAASREEKRQRVAATIATLRSQTSDPKRLRKINVFELYWLHNWTMEELAKKEGVAISTIWHWLEAIKRDFGDGYRRL